MSSIRVFVRPTSQRTKLVRWETWNAWKRSCLEIPEAIRVDIEAWDGEPTFRVNGKNFIFTNKEATSVSVKLPPEEATAVVASDALVVPTGYGLGRHGWVSVEVKKRTNLNRWKEIEEWVRTSLHPCSSPSGLPGLS